MQFLTALAARVRRMKLKDWRALIAKIIPHAAIVISGMLIVFFAIDRVNKPMGFMTNEFHKRITFALSLMAIYLAVKNVTLRRRAERERYRRMTRNAGKTGAARPKPAAPSGNGRRKP